MWQVISIETEPAKTKRVEKSRVQYITAGTAVTLTHCLFPIFCAILYLSIQQPHALNTVQYLAEGDVSKANWFQEKMVQVPKS